MSFSLTQMGRTFTQNTNSLQKAVELTQEQLAHHVGLSTSTLHRIETARVARRTYRPSFATVAKLALLAGVSIDDFVNTRLSFEG